MSNQKNYPWIQTIYDYMTLYTVMRCKVFSSYTLEQEVKISQATDKGCNLQVVKHRDVKDNEWCWG